VQCYHSNTAIHYGINNMPTSEAIVNMMVTAEKLYDPLYEHFGKELRLNSFYRSAALCEKLGSKPTSQHCRGQAIDIETTSNKELFEWIIANLKFDQIIWEFGDVEPDWVHVSYAPKLRRSILRSVREGGKTVYKTLKM